MAVLVFYVLACAAAFLLYIFGYDWVAAVRDAGRTRVPEAGLLSNFGIIAMTVTGVCLATAAIRQPRASIILLSLFCLLFAYDDGTMFHEGLGPYEPLVFPVYGVLLTGVWVAFARETGQWIIWPIAVVFLAFIASVFADQYWGHVARRIEIWPFTEDSRLRYAFEDLTKLAGLLLLCVVGLNVAFGALLDRPERSPTSSRA